MFDISVLVLTYNSDWNKLRQTLFSILIQKGVKFEIVIADDGSKVNHADKIVNFFSENNFIDYKLINNPVNQGTVLNTISGLTEVSSDYVKDISPGDMLYDENTLFKFLQVIRKNKNDIYFGKGIYYSAENNNDVFYTKKSPKNITVYKKRNIRQIQKNYLIKKDYILGALFIIKTAVYLEYLRKIENIVIYAEDCSVIYMIAEGIIPVFVDLDLIWYEYGSGISTNKNIEWQKILKKDNERLFNCLLEQKLISSNIYNLSYSKSVIKKIFLNFFYNPQIFVSLIIKKTEQTYQRKDVDKLKFLLKEI